MIYQRLGIALMLVALLSITGGCGWTSTSDWDLGVWSDDEEGIAMVQRFYEKKEEMMTDRHRNYEFEVWRSDYATPNNKTKVSDRLTGRPLEIYYFHSQGYLVVGRRLANDENGPEIDRVRWDKILMDGTRTEILALDSSESLIGLESESVPAAIIPSPDGSSLARIVASPEGVIDVSFLDADSLTLFDGPYTLTLSPEAIDNGSLRPAWFEDGRFLIASVEWEGEGQYWIFQDGSAPVLSAPVDRSCWNPPTSSSGWRADGLHVQCVPEGEIVFETDAGDFKFGCD